MPDNPPFYKPGYTPEARKPTAGFELWRLQNGSRVLTCEIRNDGRPSAAEDVQLLEDGELLVHRDNR